MTMDPLERRNLPLRLADEIERAIRQGEWEGFLPGHRALMKTYAVSAKTCIAAMEHLETRKLVGTAETGKRRRILVKHPPAASSLDTLLAIVPTGTTSGGLSASFHSKVAAWEAYGGRVVKVEFDFTRYRNPSHLLRETIARYRADAVYLLLAPRAWNRAAASLRPVFLDGGEFGIKQPLTGVGYRLGNEIFRAAEHMALIGHRRILVPLPSMGSHMILEARTHLAKALRVPVSLEELEKFCPVFPDAIPAVWAGCWERALKAARPTAAILLTDIHYHSFFGFCASRGISIPRDLSTLCLETSPSLEWSYPLPARMRYPEERAVSYFKKWMRGKCAPLGWKNFELELITGDSLKPLLT